MKDRHLFGYLLVVCVLLFATVFLGLYYIFGSNFRVHYAKLYDDYSVLSDDFDKLQEQYASLQQKYDLLLPSPSGSDEYNLNKTLLKMYYDLKEEYENYVTEYQRLRGFIEQRLLRSNVEAMITPSDPEVIKLVEEISGGTDVSQPDKYWPIIKEMYDWIKTNIEYRPDGLYPVLPYNPEDDIEHKDQMVQFPNETLAMKEGDCEDQSVLLTSMIRAFVGTEFTVECVWITSETYGHVAVQIPVTGQKTVILDTVGGYYTQDAFGNLALENISIETYNWLGFWRPTMGNDIYVFRVFSDYIDQYFTTTAEYINWMYSRF